LLRDKGDYPLLLPPDVDALIEAFAQTPPPSQLPPPLFENGGNLYCIRLVEILTKIWTRTWEPTLGNFMTDPTMCFVTLSCIRRDYGWAEPTQVTPLLARMIYNMRTIFLFDLHFYDTGPVDVRERYMMSEGWHCQGRPSTFDTLYSLQHLASSIAYQTPSLPAFTWYNDQRTEFVWHGAKITLSMFREMGQELMQLTYEAFFDKVFLGIDWSVSGYLADDLSNTSPGYSFVTDARNSKYYDRTAFMREIMETPHLREEFVIAVTPQGTPLLNLARARTWLNDYSNALGWLMTNTEVEGGSPSRGTELTCIQLLNTPYRTRGLYAIGPCIAIFCQYSKTSANMGRDTLIPHVLDAFSQEIIKIVAFKAHPFAQQLIKILYPNKPNLLSLWRTNLFVKYDRLFDTDDISSTLRMVSLKSLETPLGIRDYRQMSIFIRRMHCPTLESMFALSEDDNKAALQAGHSMATEERVYGVSSGYLGRLPENLIEPYVKASTEWQVLMRVPEGGKQVTLTDFTDKVAWARYISPDKSPYLRNPTPEPLIVQYGTKPTPTSVYSSLSKLSSRPSNQEASLTTTELASSVQPLVQPPSPLNVNSNPHDKPPVEKDSHVTETNAGKVMVR